MERISYARVAAAIVAAKSNDEMRAASELAIAYYATEPTLESVPTRMALLKAALLRSVES